MSQSIHFRPVLVQAQVEKAKEEINEKKRQIRMLEQRIKTAVTSQPIANAFEMSQVQLWTEVFLVNLAKVTGIVRKSGGSSALNAVTSIIMTFMFARGDLEWGTTVRTRWFVIFWLLLTLLWNVIAANCNAFYSAQWENFWPWGMCVVS